MSCLVVQEGGYNNRSIGTNAKCFFQGLLSGMGQTDSQRQLATGLHTSSHDDTNRKVHKDFRTIAGK